MIGPLGMIEESRAATSDHTTTNAVGCCGSCSACWACSRNSVSSMVKAFSDRAEDHAATASAGSTASHSEPAARSPGRSLAGLSDGSSA